MDIMSPEERSKRMSLIRSKWTNPEKKVHNYLKGMRIRHQMHPKMSGNPDVLLKDKRVVIFIHGCFWHKCPSCYRAPASRRAYWKNKVEKNAKRDRKHTMILRKEGWKTVRVWEHELQNDMSDVARKILVES